jgi:hypothetical protein
MTIICAYCKRAKHGDDWVMEWTRQDYLDVIDLKASRGCCPECAAVEMAKTKGE